MEGAELDRWRRAQELFEAAADLRPSEQAAYLAAACPGDHGLRREVEALLRSDAEAGSFIEHAIRRGSDQLLAGEPDPLEALGRIGKYEILGRIGEGGFGVVYKGRDAVLQRYVAVKTCSSSDDRLRRRFFREGQIAASLQHPNITTVHDLGVERGIPYLVQEFLAGEDLNRKIARREELSALRRLDLLVQVARGLEYAHLQGVLHRDVKPANIRVLPSGAVKIMDFGIAKLLHEVSDVTTQGVTLGTVGYLAPEQLRGEEVDRRTDIFSFGVLVHEVLTYERPFKGSTFSEVSYRLLNEEPAALAEIGPAHGEAIAELARRCLAKDPRQRYETFAEILAVLEPELAALRSGPLAVPSPAVPAAQPATPAMAGGGPGSPSAVTARRRVSATRAMGGAAAAIVLAAILVAGGRAWVRRQVPSGAETAAVPAGSAAAAGSVTVPAGSAAAGERPGVGQQPAAGTGSAGSAGTGMAVRGDPAGHGPMGTANGAAGDDALHPHRTAPAPNRRGAAAALGVPPAPGSERMPAGRAAKPRSEPVTPGRPASAGTAGAAPEGSGEAGPRRDGPLPAPDPEGAGRASRPAADLPGSAPPAGLGAGSAAATGSVGGESRRALGPAPGTRPADAEGSVVEPGRVRPMVRGDLIPPGAPGTSPPRLLSRPEPQYPDRARRRQAESEVLMLVLVDENGQVVRAIVKQTDDPGLGFNEAARLAAMRARFSPATRDGLAGKMWTELPFSFRLHPG
jgi:TonB family protein